jgi:8-oxo-dGTP pyrophosphatase MutT (NUDIX family)
MSQENPAPVPVRPAATLILVRDAPEGLQCLMITRHVGIAFAGGAAVFPGGRVDAAEDSVLCRLARNPTGLAVDELMFRVAAVRETFEEAGILLACPRGSEALLCEPPTLPPGPLAEQLQAAQLELTTDRLVPFAHWITPASEAKRFDTRFYLAALPAEHGGVHAADGGEAVHAGWITPADGIAAFEADRMVLLPPTLYSLQRLAKCQTAADAVADATATPVVTILPVLEFTAEGVYHNVPAEAGLGYTRHLIRNSVATLLKGGAKAPQG